MDRLVLGGRIEADRHVDEPKLSEPFQIARAIVPSWLSDFYQVSGDPPLRYTPLKLLER